MDVFANIPMVSSPFCSRHTSSVDMAEEFSDDSSNYISYKHGIPINYSVMPASQLKIKFTRKEMNRLAYDATAGSFNAQFGCVETYNPVLAAQIHGYPRGTMLKWFQFSTVLPWHTIPEGITPDFNGTWNAFDENKIYRNGDVVCSPYGVYPKLWIGTGLDGTERLSWHQFTDRAEQIVISSMFDVVSTIDGNQNDFRSTGPTNENGWVLADSQTMMASPDYSALSDDDSIIGEGHNTDGFSIKEVAIESDGWIVVSCSRELNSEDFQSIIDLVSSYSDGITIRLGDTESGVEEIAFPFQFGASDRIARSIPVKSGQYVSADVTNNTGATVSLVVRFVGKSI